MKYGILWQPLMFLYFAINLNSFTHRFSIFVQYIYLFWYYIMTAPYIAQSQISVVTRLQFSLKFQFKRTLVLVQAKILIQMDFIQYLKKSRKVGSFNEIMIHVKIPIQIDFSENGLQLEPLNILAKKLHLTLLQDISKTS